MTKQKKIFGFIYRPVISLLLILLALPKTAVSEDGKSPFPVPDPEDVTLKITGRLVEPAPCTITGTGEKGTISVNFGRVNIDKIDGNNYRRPINYQIECIANRTNSLMITITGAPAPFGTGLLQTDVDSLAILMTNEGSAFPINTMLNFTWPTLPNLYATPVARSGAVLKGQPFSASAIMQVYYQ